MWLQAETGNSLLFASDRRRHAGQLPDHHHRLPRSGDCRVEPLPGHDRGLLDPNDDVLRRRALRLVTGECVEKVERQEIWVVSNVHRAGSDGTR